MGRQLLESLEDRRLMSAVHALDARNTFDAGNSISDPARLGTFSAKRSVIHSETVGAADPADYFSINTTVAEHLAIALKTPIQFGRLAFLDASGNTLASTGGPTLTPNVSPGTWYIAVIGATSSVRYTLTIKSTPLGSKIAPSFIAAPASAASITPSLFPADAVVTLNAPGRDLSADRTITVTLPSSESIISLSPGTLTIPSDGLFVTGVAVTISSVATLTADPLTYQPVGNVTQPFTGITTYYNPTIGNEPLTGTVVTIIGGTGTVNLNPGNVPTDPYVGRTTVNMIVGNLLNSTGGVVPLTASTSTTYAQATLQISPGAMIDGVTFPNDSSSITLSAVTLDFADTSLVITGDGRLVMPASINLPLANVAAEFTLQPVVSTDPAATDPASSGAMSISSPAFNIFAAMTVDVPTNSLQLGPGSLVAATTLADISNLTISGQSATLETPDLVITFTGVTTTDWTLNFTSAAIAAKYSTATTGDNSNNTTTATGVSDTNNSGTRGLSDNDVVPDGNSGSNGGSWSGA